MLQVLNFSNSSFLLWFLRLLHNCELYYLREHYFSEVMHLSQPERNVLIRVSSEPN